MTLNYDPSFVPSAIRKVANLLDGFIESSYFQEAIHPWHVIELFSKNFAIPDGIKFHGFEKNCFLKGNLLVDKDVQLPPFVYIEGPVYIAKGAIIHPFSTIIGPAYIGENSEIRHYSIVKNSIIAPGSVIGNYVEIKCSVVLNNTVISHKNIISSSFIGEECWFPGEASIANLRLDRKSIQIYIGDQAFSSGIKYGATVESKVRVPARTSIMPGTYIPFGLSIPFNSTLHGFGKIYNLSRRKHQNFKF